ncbi:hypothetical protein OG562_19500 [Streptomyces sp. NBC_01275]|uniref:hypothetical protein n=1 Tax=Streptomyces sp. NBC_01275 TaxID=2903807 RepID=UPI0022546247|nr:hypothetical protein [Streptomyces sp. NBC_01275]MCX4763126.1 hypothetical protein [Streptomyces sp. NBC_01275]
MLLLSTLWEFLGLFAGMAAQTRLGAVGLMLLFTLGVGVRARHNGLAVGAAVALVVLMTQA